MDCKTEIGLNKKDLLDLWISVVIKQAVKTTQHQHVSVSQVRELSWKCFLELPPMTPCRANISFPALAPIHVNKINGCDCFKSQNDYAAIENWNRKLPELMVDTSPKIPEVQWIPSRKKRKEIQNKTHHSESQNIKDKQKVLIAARKNINSGCTLG